MVRDDAPAATAECETRRLARISLIRAAFAFAWAIAAMLLPPSSGVVTAGLLIIYPLWDAGANLIDARASDGPPATLAWINMAISLIAAAAVWWSLQDGSLSVLTVFGMWAVSAGLLQLGVGLYRRRLPGQWFMIISGAQSAVIGALFIRRSATVAGQPADLAIYALFGGAYFLLTWILLKRRVRSDTADTAS